MAHRQIDGRNDADGSGENSDQLARMAVVLPRDEEQCGAAEEKARKDEHNQDVSGERDHATAP